MRLFERGGRGGMKIFRRNRRSFGLRAETPKDDDASAVTSTRRHESVLLQTVHSESYYLSPRMFDGLRFEERQNSSAIQWKSLLSANRTLLHQVDILTRQPGRKAHRSSAALHISGKLEVSTAGSRLEQQKKTPRIDIRLHMHDD